MIYFTLQILVTSFYFGDSSNITYCGDNQNITCHPLTEGNCYHPNSLKNESIDGKIYETHVCVWQIYSDNELRTDHGCPSNTIYCGGNTRAPTQSPLAPTKQPTLSPITISIPTLIPTATTQQPTITITTTENPTPLPTPRTTTREPTRSPTQQPTSNPIRIPTVTPTIVPTATPTLIPTTAATTTRQPTKYPTKQPSINPSRYNVIMTNVITTQIPTIIAPTIRPTLTPIVSITSTTQQPTQQPTNKVSTISPTISSTADVATTKTPDDTNVNAEEIRTTRKPPIIGTKEPTKQPSVNEQVTITELPTLVTEIISTTIQPESGVNIGGDVSQFRKEETASTNVKRSGFEKLIAGFLLVVFIVTIYAAYLVLFSKNCCKTN